jgi:hypothetical protein
MMKHFFLSAVLLSAPALAQPLVPATTADGRSVMLRAEYVPASDFAPEMAEANAAAALPPLAPDPRLAPSPAEARTLAPRAMPQTAAAPLPPLPVVYQRTIVQPMPIPVGYAPAPAWGGGGWGGGGWGGGGWGGGWGAVPVLGWGGGWNRGYRGGWNRGWNGSWNRGYRGGWGCRSTGSGALLGTVAGAVIGYGLSDPWNRGTGTVIGGVVGGLAGSAIERSGRC